MNITEEECRIAIQDLCPQPQNYMFEMTYRVAKDMYDKVVAYYEIQNQWISANDQLPEDYRDVLTIDKFNVCRVLCIYGDRWHDTDTSYATDYITHWMPLPAPPITNADHRKQRGRTVPNRP